MTRKRLRAAALALLACAALAAPATAEQGASHPQRSSPVIVGDDPADYPGMPGAPAGGELAAPASSGGRGAGGFALTGSFARKRRSSSASSPAR
jgi:hypothetical protein